LGLYRFHHDEKARKQYANLYKWF
jgi:elongation factor 1-gamma